MMKYKAIEQTVQAVQITPDIDMIAPDWFAKKMNTEEIMIDRAQRDGAISVIGCTIYFNARKSIEQTVQAVQITPDIDMIAPDWFAKKMNTEEIMIDRAQRDGAISVIGCTIYFNARKYKGSRLVARIGDYVVKDSVGRLNVVRKNDFDRLYKKEEA